MQYILSERITSSEIKTCCIAE